MKKKLVIILLIFVILIAQIGITNFLNNSKVMASEHFTEWNSYFYKQLEPNAKKIYEAMYKMFTEDVFLKGESMEITDYVTPASVSLFVNGNNQLLLDYGAARDAFQYDNPDCFYVDWDNLSVRVVQDKLGAFHVYLGAGRTDTYLLKGMNENRCETANGGYGKGVEGAVKQYEAKLTEVVNAIKNNTKLTDGEGTELEEIESDAYQGSNNKDVDEVIRMVGEAHDYVVKNMVYRHEEDLVPGDRLCKLYGIEEHKDEHSTCRTAYDGLIYKTGVCEAYTRTFKAILDRLGIPCVCVYGIYSPKSTINEPHIWNYVQIDGKWYGVDVTHDDPTNSRWWYQRNSTHETREFWLVGEGTLASHHFPQGIMSSANFNFTYPELSHNSLRESYVNTTDDGIKVVIEKDSQFDDQTDEVFDSGTVYISYNGKNYTQNAKEGKYIIVKNYMYEPGTDTWTTSDWYYIDPWYICYWNKDYWNEIESPNPKYGSEETGDAEYFTRIEYPQIRQLEVAVTDVPPIYTPSKIKFEEAKFTKDDRETDEYKAWEKQHHELMINGGAYFTEAEDTLKIRSDVIENNWGNYVKPPMCITLSPGGTLYAEDWHTIVMKFDEKLKLKPGCKESDIKINLTTSGGAGISVDNAGATAGENAVLKDIKWNGSDEVSFTFRASQMWADDHTYYTFQVENLIGVGSEKQPLLESIGMTFRRYCSVYKAQGYERNVYGQPQLMDSNDISLDDWEIKDNLTGDGKEMTFDDYMNDYMKNQAEGYGNNETFLNALRERLTLVTAETSPNQKTQMEDAIENQFGKDNIVSGTVNTYNISITTCQMQVVKTGQGVRIALGFPAGTTYEDFAQSGRLKFKAYHYIVDPETDKLTGEVEEIPVTVTRQGLVLLVKSFSPFTVAAIENPTPIVDTTKTLVTAASVGGSIKLNDEKLEGANANIDFKQGDEKTFTISADEGYEIDNIMLNGSRLKVSDSNNESVKISYDMFSTGDSLSVSFVAKEIHEEEASKGLSNSFNLPNINISFEKNSYEYVVGDKIAIKANVTAVGDDFHQAGDPLADPEHPDKLEYTWYRVTGGRPSPLTVVENSKTDTLTIDKADVKRDTYNYHLCVTPLKWNKDKNEYENLYKDEHIFTQYSNSIKIKVYNELEIDLTGEETNKLGGTKDDGYTLSLDVGSIYKLNAKLSRADSSGNKTEEGGRNITWTSSNEEIISVNNSGDIQAHKYSADPVTITATVVDINGAERKVSVTVNVNEIAVSDITVSTTKEKIQVEEEATLTATIKPDDATTTKVTWTLDEASKEIIDIKEESNTTAIVTGKKLGKATVKATAGGKEAECIIEVVETPVESIADDVDDPNNVTIAEGTSGRVVHAEVLPKNATDKKITWTTSNSNVATVVENEDGSVTFKPGTYVEGGDNTCTITATSSNGKTREYKIILEKQFIPADENGVTIDPTSATIKVGENFDFNFKVTPVDATVASEVWSVEIGTDVVSIDNSGIVTGLKVGKATVKVVVTCQNPTCPTHTATAEVTVNPVEATSIELDKKEMTLIKGSSDTLEVTKILPENTTNKTITWKVNPEIAELTPSEDGMSVKVVAKTTGTATITASCNGVNATCALTVEKVNVESVNINEQDITIRDDVAEADKPKLTVSYYPEDADNKEVEWSVSPEEIITVSADGTITPTKQVDEDTVVTVTATVKGTNITATTQVTVVPSQAEVVVYTVDQNDNFLPGFTLRLEKIDENGGNPQLIQEISADGKFDFGKLKDGKYKLSTTGVTQKDFSGNEVDVIKINEAVEIVVEDGKIAILQDGKVTVLDALVLKNIVDYPDSENEDELLATVEDVKENTEARYQEFIKTKPADPEPEPSNPKPNSGKDESKDPAKNPSGGGGGPAPSGAENPVGAVNNPNNSPLPKTSDIAIGTFIVVMVISLAGIIYIIYKKNKR